MDNPLYHSLLGVARFSVAHHITGSAAWVAALVIMALPDVLTWLAVIYLRGRRLATAPAAAARIPAAERAQARDGGSAFLRPRVWSLADPRSALSHFHVEQPLTRRNIGANMQ